MDWNTQIINEFRENKGVVKGQFEGMTLLLLNYTGAKTGTQYTKPLVYSMEGDKYIVAASKGGHPMNPDWYYSVIKDPNVTIEVGEDKFSVKVIDAKDAERERLYNLHASKYPNFAEYRQATSREIPVLVLEKI